MWNHFHLEQSLTLFTMFTGTMHCYIQSFINYLLSVYFLKYCNLSSNDIDSYGVIVTQILQLIMPLLQIQEEGGYVLFLGGKVESSNKKNYNVLNPHNTFTLLF